MLFVIRDAAQVLRVADGCDFVTRDCSIVLRDGRIDWLGPTGALPESPGTAEVLDAAGKTVLPGFIDSHTHLVFAGSREDEFEQRIQGLTYQEIAERGGGINATVDRVRRASRDELKSLARPRLERMLRYGITTVEVKSGYGLNLADEIKCLEVIAELNAEGPLELVPTFLGAHALPPEFRQDRDGYIRALSNEMLPEVARLRLAE